MGCIRICEYHFNLIDDYVLDDPDTSFYSQSGISVWDILRVSGDDGQESLVVVHDIERLNPTICDIYSLMG